MAPTVRNTIQTLTTTEEIWILRRGRSFTESSMQNICRNSLLIKVCCVTEKTRPPAGKSVFAFFTQFSLLCRKQKTHTHRYRNASRSWQPHVRACTNCAWTASERSRKLPYTHTHTRRCSHTCVYIKDSLTNTCLLSYQILCILLQLLRKPISCLSVCVCVCVCFCGSSRVCVLRWNDSDNCIFRKKKCSA